MGLYYPFIKGPDFFSPPKTNMENEQKPGCLGYIGDNTTHLYRGYDKPL